MLPLCEWNGLLVNVGFSKVMVVAIENTKSHHVIYILLSRGGNCNLRLFKYKDFNIGMKKINVGSIVF